MRLRFVAWNINGMRPLHDQLRLLEDEPWDVLALLEVTERNWPALQEALPAGAYSLHLRPRLPDEGKNRGLGCAVFTRGDFGLRDAFLVPGVPLPERELCVHVSHLDGDFLVANCSLPPGSSWGDVKPQTARALADWFSKRELPLIVGIDANAPKFDRPDLAKSEWWYPEEALLLGTASPHDLRDAYRLLTERQPEFLARSLALRPEGPLALSYVRGQRALGTACRYDFVLVSPEWTVLSARYRYEDAVAAGSDHALVAADLAIQ